MAGEEGGGEAKATGGHFCFLFFFLGFEKINAAHTISSLRVFFIFIFRIIVGR